MLAVCLPPVIARLGLNEEIWFGIGTTTISWWVWFAVLRKSFSPRSPGSVAGFLLCVSQEAPTNGGAENSNCNSALQLSCIRPSLSFDSATDFPQHFRVEVKKV
jgi:hypothetical protein